MGWNHQQKKDLQVPGTPQFDLCKVYVAYTYVLRKFISKVNVIRYAIVWGYFVAGKQLHGQGNIHWFAWRVYPQLLATDHFNQPSELEIQIRNVAVWWLTSGVSMWLVKGVTGHL